MFLHLSAVDKNIKLEQKTNPHDAPEVKGTPLWRFPESWSQIQFLTRQSSVMLKKPCFKTVSAVFKKINMKTK